MNQIPGIVIFGAVVLVLSAAAEIVRCCAVSKAETLQDAYEQETYHQWEDLKRKFGHHRLNWR